MANTAPPTVAPPTHQVVTAFQSTKQAYWIHQKCFTLYSVARRSITSSGTKPRRAVQPICGTSQGRLISSTKAADNVRNMTGAFFIFTNLRIFS